MLDVDDVSYRLKLLVKNNYFLPPPHLKPTPDQLSALPTTPLKSPTLRALFRPNKSPKTPQQPPPIPQVPVYTPRITRPQNRVVVIRETLSELIPEPLPLSDEYTSPVETFIDPTDDVDGVQLVAEPPTSTSTSSQGTDRGDWRTDLLAQAVGLSFVNPPPRKQSLPPEQPAPLGQPISLLTNVPSRPSDQSSIRPSVIQPSVLRTPGPPSSALKPPPRPPRERTRRTDESPVDSSPSSPNASVQNHSPVRYNQDQNGIPEPEPIRPSFTQSPRPSFSQSIPYAPSPFGQPTSPPPRFSGATDHTLSTATLHLSDHEHDTVGRYSASRPSFSASSIHSEPRPSMAESRVSHYSTTFGDRTRDHERQSRASARSSDVTGPNSRRSSLAYLRDTRSRSLSPSRGTPTAATFEPPPVPPLPVPIPTGSDTEASTVIYVHSTGALSNTALDASSAASRLDPKRGITNAPPSPSSPRFFGLKSPKVVSGKLAPATVDVDILLQDMQDEEEQQQEASSNTSVEAWQHSQIHQEAARKFDGMVEQHIESEKDRFKRIASRGKSD